MHHYHHCIALASAKLRNAIIAATEIDAAVPRTPNFTCYFWSHGSNVLPDRVSFPAAAAMSPEAKRKQPQHAPQAAPERSTLSTTKAFQESIEDVPAARTTPPAKALMRTKTLPSLATLVKKVGARRHRAGG
jgi:hypothetical protein